MTTPRLEQTRPARQGFPWRLFAAAFAVSMLTAMVSGWHAWQLKQRFVAVTARQVDVTEYVGRIMLFDEILTMSARMAAATGDLRYEQRYDKFDDALDALIKKTRSLLARPDFRRFVAETDAANRELAGMQRRAFGLMHQDRRAAAVALLTSAEYARWQKIYAANMAKLAAGIKNAANNDVRQLSNLFSGLAVANIVGVIMLLVTWLYALRAGRSWAQERADAEAALRGARDALERRVEERTAALGNEIAGHRSAREQLGFANAVLTAAMESSPDGILVVATGRSTASFNRRFAQMWSLPPGIVRSRDHEAALAAGLRQLKDPEALLSLIRHLEQHPDARAQRDFELADGRVFEGHARGMRGAANEYLGRVWFFRDITERKRGEATLRASEARFRTIFNAVNDGIFLSDPADGRFIDVNDAGCRMFGYRRDEIVGQGIPMLSSGEPCYSQNAALDLLDKARTEGPQTFEWHGKAKDGTLLWVEISLRRTAFGPAEVALATVRDISERKRSVEALAYRDRILHAVMVGTTAMAGAEPFEPGMTEALRVVGETIDVDRVTVIADAPGCDPPAKLQYLWESADVPVRLDAAAFAAVPVGRAVLDAWRAPLKQRQPVITHLDSAGAIRPLLDQLHIRSMLLVPVFVAGESWGNIGIDACRAAREWTSTEIETLATFAEVIGALIGRDRARNLLEQSEERFRAVSETAQDAIIMIDAAGKIRYWNRSAERVTGYGAAEAAGKDLHDWLAPPRFRDKAAAGLPEFARTGKGAFLGKTLELAALHKDGSEFPIEVSVAPMRLGGERFAVGILRDISERKRSEQQILQMARADALTGLANRRVFVEAIEQAIARARRGEAGFALLYLDLDHFKDVNDTLGHPAGDALLQRVAMILRETVREIDLIARFGGDEFSVLAGEIRDPADAGALADRLLQAVSEPLMIGDNQIRSGASVGIAVYAPDTPDAESLLAHADVALYRAKSEGRGIYRFFTEAMDREVRERVGLAGDLRAAIAADRLYLVYQPEVEIGSGRIIGLEALVRWEHPRLGALPPPDFVAMAERSGAIGALGHWVLETVCRQLRQWIDAGLGPPVTAVNMSALQFKSPLELERDIAAILSANGLPPHLIAIELTETALMETLRVHNDVLQRLQQSGIKLAIDDFGMGYSSLDYLRRFPADRIKIAQDFVARITESAVEATIVRAAIRLAQELGLEVVAEGVETKAQLALLQSWGCREAQGYYFARPLPPEEVAPLLRAGRVRGQRQAAGAERRTGRATRAGAG